MPADKQLMEQNNCEFGCYYLLIGSPAAEKYADIYLFILLQISRIYITFYFTTSEYCMFSLFCFNNNNDNNNSVDIEHLHKTQMETFLMMI